MVDSVASAQSGMAGEPVKKLGPRCSRQSWSICVVVTVIGGLLCASCGDSQPPVASAQDDAASQPRRVAGLGRIEPGDGIVRVAARAQGGSAIVGRLLVRQGDTVRAGQVLAELDNKEELQAAVQLATSRTEVAKRRVAQVRAGAKTAELSAQQADIEALESELENARSEHRRYASLGTNVTASELDRLQLRVDSTTRALAAARQRLAALTEVRSVDVDVTQAELEEALRSEARARADAKTSIIHAPIDGRVIEIHAWPGEQVGVDGLLELAPAEPMYAVAEVSESDITRVRVGQRATIAGDGLDAPLQGTVERISARVLQNQIMPVSPVNFSDARVVEVWIRLDDGRAVTDLIHLRVDVIIES